MEAGGNSLDASAVIQGKLLSMTLLRMAMAMLEISVSGLTCSSTETTTLIDKVDDNHKPYINIRMSPF